MNDSRVQKELENVDEIKVQVWYIAKISIIDKSTCPFPNFENDINSTKTLTTSYPVSWKESLSDSIFYLQVQSYLGGIYKDPNAMFSVGRLLETELDGLEWFRQVRPWVSPS
jgi:hypothetical protein